MVPRDDDLDRGRGSMNLFRRDPSKGAGVQWFCEWYRGDAQASDEGRADEVGIGPGIQKDRNLELGSFPQDSRRQDRLGGGSGRVVSNAHQDHLTR